MQISRIVIRNFRSFRDLDIRVNDDLCCIIGENNTGKTAIFRAIQICLDMALPSVFRSLIREDIHAALDISQPSQVLIGIELTDFAGTVNEEALVSTWKTEADRARIFYRFRPKPSVRESLENGEHEAGTLTLEDYAWEIKAGGNPATDLTQIEWNDEDIGQTVRFSDLQSFLVIHLPALRDVESDLRSSRQSPLVRLIEACQIGQDEQNALIEILNTANQQIEGSATIAEIATAIDTSFKSVSGPAFAMDVTLGLSSATFQSIIRNLKMLLSDLSLRSFEPARNGLGMNNILYIAILIEYLQRRQARATSSGQLVLIEEPEAHLHPQLQAALLIALRDIGVQVILTTHSTQIASLAPFPTLVSLTRRADATIASGNLSTNAALSAEEIADLERYLDATKSNLLFARRVMLVEGPAELFLIPAMVEAVHGIKLEREGISMVAIYGVHFDVYAKLFRAGALEKKCAIVADADLAPSDASEEFDIAIDAPNLDALRGDFVEVFAGATTFERELVSAGTLPMLIEATRSLGAPNITAQLENGYARLVFEDLNAAEQQALLTELGTLVLNTAKRFGKARFAQVASRHANRCTTIPQYIQDALDWLNA